MFSAGMLLGSIFETLSRHALGNRYFEEKLRVVHRRIEQGEPISLAFENVEGFPSLLLGALRNGETTGTLDKTLNRLGDYYDTEVKRSVQALVSAIEPMTIIILGGIFGLIVLSILLPLYDVLGEFGKAY
jgi:type IV pilus assembly protein PilC